MIYLFAGHHDKDPGAVHSGVKESDLTKVLRNETLRHLTQIDAVYARDKDEETLAQLIKRIKPGTGSVLCDLHFNASQNPNACGIEVLVKNQFTQHEHRMASEICLLGADILRTKNRGVKTESQSARGKLGILNTPAGVSVLVEVCFMTNEVDMFAYNLYKDEFAHGLAGILKHYDELFL